MLRKARIDAPGALHHIIVRGIERRKVFYDDKDRNNLIKRLDAVLTNTQTACFAWSEYGTSIGLFVYGLFFCVIKVVYATQSPNRRTCMRGRKIVEE